MFQKYSIENCSKKSWALNSKLFRPEMESYTATAPVPWSLSAGYLWCIHHSPPLAVAHLGYQIAAATSWWWRWVTHLKATPQMQREWCWPFRHSRVGLKVLLEGEKLKVLNLIRTWKNHLLRWSVKMTVVESWQRKKEFLLVLLLLQTRCMDSAPQGLVKMEKVLNGRTPN